jgi:hypothetical protein
MNKQKHTVVKHKIEHPRASSGWAATPLPPQADQAYEQEQRTQVTSNQGRNKTAPRSDSHMFEHTRTRSGKYPNHAHQFKCCNSFISDSSLVICYKFVLLDRAWPHMYPTTSLSPKPESYRQVKLAQTLERNRTATSKNQSKPDPSQPASSTKPSKLCSTPQHLKKYLQKVAQTIHRAYPKLAIPHPDTAKTLAQTTP